MEHFLNASIEKHQQSNNEKKIKMSKKNLYNLKRKHKNIK